MSQGPGGGTGRRRGLKPPGWKHLVGSNPTPGTTLATVMARRLGSGKGHLGQRQAVRERWETPYSRPWGGVIMLQAPAWWAGGPPMRAGGAQVPLRWPMTPHQAPSTIGPATARRLCHQHRLPPPHPPPCRQPPPATDGHAGGPTRWRRRLTPTRCGHSRHGAVGCETRERRDRASA